MKPRPMQTSSTERLRTNPNFLPSWTLCRHAPTGSSADTRAGGHRAGRTRPADTHPAPPICAPGAGGRAGRHDGTHPPAAESTGRTDAGAQLRDQNDFGPRTHQRLCPEPAEQTAPGRDPQPLPEHCPRRRAAVVLGTGKFRLSTAAMPAIMPCWRSPNCSNIPSAT